MATVEESRSAIAALPAVEERVTWSEDVTYRVADRIFAMTGFEPVDVTIRTTPVAPATRACWPSCHPRTVGRGPTE